MVLYMIKNIINVKNIVFTVIFIVVAGILLCHVRSCNREPVVEDDNLPYESENNETIEGFTTGIRQSIRPHIRSYNDHKNNILSVVNYHKNRVFRYIGM
jgi:hypothetical protein